MDASQPLVSGISKVKKALLERYQKNDIFRQSQVASIAITLGLDRMYAQLLCHKLMKRGFLTRTGWGAYRLK